MTDKARIIRKAFQEGRTRLTEHEAKSLLRLYGIPVTREIEIRTIKELQEAVIKIRYPLVIKGSSPSLAHKTEQGMIRLDIRNGKEARAAFHEVMSRAGGQDCSVLVQEMVKGSRELMVGMVRDPQFGPSVMFGLGGIFTEILKDVSFRIAPLEKRDALDMLREIRAHRILDEVRGMPAADLERLCQILIKVGEIGLENDSVKEIDINPVILSGSKPVAVDALVIMEPVC
jgi:succinyl-CoA synthetase beta subunit